MTDKYAILIDAGFLKRKLGSQASPMNAQDVEQFVDKLRQRSDLSGKDLYRVFYYDGEPATGVKKKPLTGGTASTQMIDFAKSNLYQSNIKLIASLKKKKYFAVRLGEAKFRGWIVNPKRFSKTVTDTEIKITEQDIKPNIQQKGVDMRIGLDISTLTLKKQVDILVVVTGDSDFVPAFKHARREGTRVFLYCLGHPITEEIYGHVDMCDEEIYEKW